MVRLICILTTTILLLSIQLLGAQEKNSPIDTRKYPTIPINTNFWNYWDHYWATWLDNHPKYEMIEVTTYDNPANPEYKLVRVFLSEKSGRKLQYYYLNDSIAMKRSRANSFYRDIVYKKKGKKGKPQGLYIKFRDKDDEIIEWTVNFDESAALKRHKKGLTPSIHSVGYILLYHLRTKTVSTTKDKVLFNGKDYAYKEEKGKKSWYNKDVYSAVKVYGKNVFTVSDKSLSSNWNRHFKKQGNVYVSEKLGRQNFIRFEVDNNDQIKTYKHSSFDHTLTFTFNPPLPNYATAKNGQIVDFSVSFDEHQNVTKGKIRVMSKGEDKLIFQWIHDYPEWSKWRPFKSFFKFTDKGYELTTYE
ncbi:hypothetical protein RQM59_12845 [Flavobacteriaceae bacterium S356]|uniref:Uncharacterized protein n=1 Tax=Asprobacillus argus TaxID=3076534 RepID=A0ABU3LHS0_9FLAO|nr:hypothetical protein [Flavobacteriaceae bacterium S356]